MVERITFRNSRNLTLAGTLYRADSASVIIMAHGFTSDKSSRGRFVYLGESLARAGFNALAFDFSGCGESAEDILSIDGEVDDLHSAVAYAKGENFREVGFYGHSLGSLICLKCWTPEIFAMAFTGALTGPMQYAWQEYFTEQQMNGLDERGFLVTADRSGRAVRIGRDMLRHFAEIDQKELLARISCPVLVMHGNSEADDEENRLWENSERAMVFLSPDSRLRVIDGANHSFMDHQDEVIRLTIQWYTDHRPLDPARGAAQ